MRHVHEILRPKLNNKLSEIFYQLTVIFSATLVFDLIVKEQWRTLPEMETSQANHQRE